MVERRAVVETGQPRRDLRLLPKAELHLQL